MERIENGYKVFGGDAGIGEIRIPVIPVGEVIQKEAKRAADKELREEGKRRGHKITGMSAYTIWHWKYTDYIQGAGYTFLNGQVVLQ